MFLSFIFACSSAYNLANVQEKNNEGAEPSSEDEVIVLEEPSAEPSQEEPSEEPIEEPEEEPVPEPTSEPEDTTEEEPEFCTEFDDFSQWNYFGDGNWYIDNNLLYENQGGYYATTAYLYNFGISNGFSMEVTAQWQGSLNDLSGFVFNLDPQTGHHWTVTIDDPQGDYGRYEPAGGILVSECVWDECSMVARDSSLFMNAPSGSPAVHLRMEVQGEQLNVYWDGTLAFSQQVQGITGPGVVGLYSNDNDGGVIYDDFCIDVF